MSDTTYTRYTVKIIGTIDGGDFVETEESIINALKTGCPKIKLKVINLDAWTNIENGETIVYDENGNVVTESTEEEENQEQPDSSAPSTEESSDS